MWPFEPYKIDTYFNKPTSYGTHEGLDLNGIGGGNTDCGYELKSICSGTCVLTSSSTANYGKLVVIETTFNGTTYWVRYAHCKEFRVSTGDTIKLGQVVALMGSTGNSTACHLHLDILKKKPSHWRYYTQSVTDWFVDPIWFIENYSEEDMSGMVSVEASKFEELVTKSTERDEYAKQFQSPAQATQLIESLKQDIANANQARKEQEARAESIRKTLNEHIADLANILDTRQDFAEIKANLEGTIKRLDDLEKYKEDHSDDSRKWAESELELKKEVNRLTSLLEQKDVLANVELSELIRELITRLKRMILRAE